MEVLVGVLEKAEYEIMPDFFGIMDAVEDILVPIISDDEMPELDNDSLLLGYAGVYSSFLRHTRRAGEQYDVDPREILIELGWMQVVGGLRGPDHRRRIEAGHGRGTLGLLRRLTLSLPSCTS